MTPVTPGTQPERERGGQQTAPPVRRPARKRTKTAVHFFVEDGFLVRGTLDPHAALALAVDVAEPYQLGYPCEEAARPDAPEEDHPSPDQVRGLADLMLGYLSTAKPGLYRIVPASPDDPDYGWFMRPAESRGRGVFQGVVFW